MVRSTLVFFKSSGVIVRYLCGIRVPCVLYFWGALSTPQIEQQPRTLEKSMRGCRLLNNFQSCTILVESVLISSSITSRNLNDIRISRCAGSRILHNTKQAAEKHIYAGPTRNHSPRAVPAHDNTITSALGEIERELST